jgi:hypothetical protein
MCKEIIPLRDRLKRVGVLMFDEAEKPGVLNGTKSFFHGQALAYLVADVMISQNLGLVHPAEKSTLSRELRQLADRFDRLGVDKLMDAKRALTDREAFFQRGTGQAYRNICRIILDCLAGSPCDSLPGGRES